VSGPIEDGGIGGGFGASLVKVGLGKLTLSHAFNTYSGGTTLKSGVLDLAAVKAAGTGAITFTAGRQTLKIENAGLSAHHLGNPIDFFGKHDVLDITGLHFHAGASAKYHRGSQLLTVRSGGETDTLTLLSPHGTHFTVANDGRGGSKVTLEQLPPISSLPAALVAHSVAGHDHVAEHWTNDIACSAGHLSDFLFTAQTTAPPGASN
jgi:autotransporter-associated beta strand protein